MSQTEKQPLTAPTPSRSRARLRRNEMLIAVTVNGKQSGDVDVSELSSDRCIMFAAFFFHEAAQRIAEDR